MSEKVENKPQNWIESTLEAIGKSSKSWYFTFIAWWVVFNWDFILLFLGHLDRLQEINQYYCGIPQIHNRLSLFGCGNIESWHQITWVKKLLLPIGMTVVSLTLFEWFIQWVLHLQEKLLNIMHNQQKTGSGGRRQGVSKMSCGKKKGVSDLHKQAK